MARYCVSVVMAALLLAPSVAMADAPAPAEAAKPTPTAKLDPAARADALADCMRRIREAKDPDDALKAYARGCSLAPRDPAIREAQVRRMLQFGKPDFAIPPAQALLAIQPDHPLAHAVAGYGHCRRKEYLKALTETAMSLAGMDKDPGVLNNAGQLVAWGESTTPPAKLSKPAEDHLSAKRSGLMNRSGFADAYGRAKAFFDRRNATAQDFDQKISAAETELEGMRKELRKIDAGIADLKKQVSDHKREMYRNKRRLGDLEDPDDRDRVRRRDRGEEDHLRRRIHEEERIIHRLESQIKQEFRSGVPKLREYRRKQAALKKLKADKAKAMSGWESVFRWDPPGVDGVVTPVSTGSGAKKPPPKVVTAAGPEGEAERLLKLVKVYRATGKENKALTLLQKLVSKYAATPAGKEAIKMIMDMGDKQGAPGE